MVSSSAYISENGHAGVAAKSEKLKNGFCKIPQPAAFENVTSGTESSHPVSNEIALPAVARKGVSRIHKAPKCQESHEECSLLYALYTYICYAVLVLAGYANDFIRPRESQEKNRPVCSYFICIVCCFSVG